MVHDITNVGLNEAREDHEEEGRIPREDSLRNMRPFEPSSLLWLLICYTVVHHNERR
jgi:hypothetical protein